MKKSKERYEDYKSTAFLFIPFGIIGLTYTCIDYFDIWKKANFITNLFQFIVAASMFAIFILIGISSYITAKSILKSIPQEDDLADKINAYLKDNLTNEYIDICISQSDETPCNDAETYYLVVESISNDIKENFPEASDEIIADLVESYYNEAF